jgi:hypothetical protein
VKRRVLAKKASRRVLMFSVQSGGLIVSSRSIIGLVEWTTKVTVRSRR